MKKLGLFFFILFASITFIYSGEVTLALGWRTSNSGLVLGEHSFPFSNTIIEEGEWEGHLFRNSQTRNYTSGEDVSLFQRRAYIVFGTDWFLYKKQVSLGFELSAGLLKRDYNVRTRYVAEEVDVCIFNDEICEDKKTTIIIPANLFLIAKYKFDSVKNSSGWIRPYIGMGGGLNSTVFLGDGITEFDENEVESGEKTFVYSGAFVAMIGTDLFFSKKAGIFIELRYVKPLSEGRNFRDQMGIGIGFRFI